MTCALGEGNVVQVVVVVDLDHLDRATPTRRLPLCAGTSAPKRSLAPRSRCRATHGFEGLLVDLRPDTFKLVRKLLLLDILLILCHHRASFAL